MSQEKDHYWKTIQCIDDPWVTWYLNKLKNQTSSQFTSDAIHKTSSSIFDHENLQNLSESQSITSNDQNKDETSCSLSNEYQKPNSS